MVGINETRDRIALALGLREPTAWERLQRADWRDYAPSRTTYDRATDAIDATSLFVGLALGVGIGLGLGYALKGNVRPAMRRARDRATHAVEEMRERMPERLRVTRMEEPANR